MRLFASQYDDPRVDNRALPSTYGIEILLLSRHLCSAGRKGCLGMIRAMIGVERVVQRISA